MNMKQIREQEQLEAGVVEMMARAKGIADATFGNQATVEVVFDIYEALLNAKSVKSDAAFKVAFKRAHEIVLKVFQGASDATAVLEVYNWISDANKAGFDAFEDDLTRVYEAAKGVFGTEQPTPEMVLGLFDAIFNDEDEDEDEE